MFKLEKNKITLKGNRTFFVIGIITVIVAIMGFWLVFMFLPVEGECTFADILGLIFVCFWVIIVLIMGIFAVFTNGKQLEINDEGVLCGSIFMKMFLKWSEIEDWGLSYCGQTRWEGNTYYFYFSKQTQPIKNECKKKLKGKMIKTFVIGSDYAEVVNKAIPFCKERTSIDPFIGKDNII